MTPHTPIDALIQTYRTHPVPIQITPAIKHYAWGQTGKTALIPKILSKNPGTSPWAELWLGTHPNGPATVTLKKHKIPLADLYQCDWLLKILAAEKMLSIQVHPNTDQAIAGRQKEIHAGIPMHLRNYKDANPKPEIAIPLTHFWALNGFLDRDTMYMVCHGVPELAATFSTELTVLKNAASPDEIADAKKTLYTHMMTLSPDKRDAVLRPSLSRLATQHTRNPYTKSHRAYWLLHASHQHRYDTHTDVGLFAFFMLNLVHLCPYDAPDTGLSDSSGDAVHLPPGTALYSLAGVPHAYLEGVCVEHMTSSDNVIRAGLTPKPVDIPELLSICDYSEKPLGCITPTMTTTDNGSTIYYPTPSTVFNTALITQRAGASYTITHTHTPQILFVLDGNLTWQTQDENGALTTGHALLIPPDTQLTCDAVSASRLLIGTGAKNKSE